MKRIVFSRFAAVGAFIALGFGAPPARADVCGDLSDRCEIADGVLDWNFDEFGDFFALDDDTCNKMAQSVFKQCEKAVKTAVKCWTDQLNTIWKNAKNPCKVQGDFADDCDRAFKLRAWRDLDTVDGQGESELDCCDDDAFTFFLGCIGDL